ncbi:hypothetical protein [Vibrio sp. 10N.261.46.A3]|uniref:hypothetical protein n=1 Tax=Vibrio sp. 10N.261.46.A3 TaxID=3229658 RepID=UPI00354E57A3
MNKSPIQVRFNDNKSIDMAMCKRYQESGNRAGTLRSDVMVGHALAQANSVLYQMILAMAKANEAGSVKLCELKKIMELVSESQSQESNQPNDKVQPDIGGMGGLSQ